MVAPKPPAPGSKRRLLIWSIMLWCVFWTAVYKAGRTQSGVPEFVYVNF